MSLALRSLSLIIQKFLASYSVQICPWITMSMLSVNLFIFTLYATSLPLSLTTWPKWLHVFSLALVLTILTLFYLAPLRKTSPYSRKHRTTLHLHPFSSILQFMYSPPAAPLASGVTSHRQPRQCRRAQGPNTVKGAQIDPNYVSRLGL